MPKMKTHKASRSRFRVTGRGKLKRTHPGRRHILTKKPSKRKRHLKKAGLVFEGQAKTYRKMFGIGKKKEKKRETS